MPHFASYTWNNPCGTVKKVFAANSVPGYDSASYYPAFVTGVVPIVDAYYVVPRTGFVRVSFWYYTVVPDTATGATVKLQVSGTDALNNSRTITPVTGNIVIDSAGGESSAVSSSMLLYCKAGTTIQAEWNFTSAFGSNGDGAMNYCIAFEMDR